MMIKNFLESKDYIEDWFQKVTTPKHSSIFQQILVPNRNVQLVSHIVMDIEVYFSNLDVNILEILIRKWLHWKYSHI